MLRLLKFMIIIVLLLIESTHPDIVEISFKIDLMWVNDVPILSCDHSYDKILQNQYMVYEGEDLKIFTKFTESFDYIICHDLFDENNTTYYKHPNTSTTFQVEKRMGADWNCTILYLLTKVVSNPLVLYNEEYYSAAYCFMKIHVRPKDPPQTILVNNMVLPAVRTNLFEKHIDFIAEYQYADGDIVAVSCGNYYHYDGLLTMEYEIAGLMSNKSIMKDLLSRKAIGFATEMNTGHNNSYMICIYTGSKDYTKVMVRFVLRTTFQIVSIKVSGKNIRPNHLNAQDNRYLIRYINIIDDPVNVVCDVERSDVQLVVSDDQLIKRGGKVSNYTRTELIRNKKTNMSFYLRARADKKIACTADYLNGTRAETVTFHFIGGYSRGPYSLDIELQSENGRMMVLFTDYQHQPKIVFYEFKDGETLMLKCGPLQRKDPGLLLYLELKDSVLSTCQTNGCFVMKTMRVTRKDETNEIICYLKEQEDPTHYSKADIVRKEIRVILRERVPTTATTTSTITWPYNSTTSTSTATSITAAAPSTALTAEITTTNTKVVPVPSDTDIKSLPLILGGSIGAVLVMLAVTGVACCFRRTRSAKRHIESPYGYSTKQNDSSTSPKNKGDNQYDVCYETPGRAEIKNPEEHLYTEIDYSRCKPNIDETQTMNSLVYDVPYPWEMQD